MTTNTKPRICGVLGVETGQPFIVHGYPNRNYPPMAYIDGVVRLYAPDGQKRHKVGGQALAWMIDHPWSVEPCQWYTPEEVDFKNGVAIVKKMNKPLRDWTLGEAQDECNSHKNDCGQCQLKFAHSSTCNLTDGVFPCDWNLSDPPRFTEDEVAAMRVLQAAGVVKIERSEEILTAWIDYRGKNLPPLMFPSIRPGQSITIAEVLKEAQHE